MDLVEIEITTPPPEKAVAGTPYKIEGVAKFAEQVGAPPWIYAEVRKKDWYKPEILEETTYERGFPIPISGAFSIQWTPRRAGIYEVTVVATPAPLPLPLIGVPPITGQSGMMKVTVGEPAYDVSEFKIITYGKEGEEMVARGTKITADPGQHIHIDVAFTYQGPRLRETLYGVLYTGVENEISGSAETAVIDTLEDVLTPSLVEGAVVIPVPKRWGETFGILVKLGNIAKDKVPDVVTITGVPAPTVTGFKIKGYYVVD